VLGILLLAFLSGAQSDDICSSKNDPYRKFNAVEIVNFALMSRIFERVGINDTSFALKNPWDSYRARNFVKKASFYANSVCRPKNWQILDDTEVDAIRHFVGATVIGYFLDKKAYRILIYHELEPGRALDNRNLMDMKNNNSGMEFADSLRREKKNLSEDELYKIATEKAIELVAQKKLVVLKSMDGECKGLVGASDESTLSLKKGFRNRQPLLLKECAEKKIDTFFCGIREL
jgi:hypothetical protein